MRRLSSSLLLFATVLFVMGCSRTMKVIATEKGVETPYDSLGTIEVNLPAKDLRLTNLMWSGVEAASFSYATTPPKSYQYADALKKELAELAKEKYNADAVIDVEYWPDLSDEKFPEGKIFARGTMIKYSKFPTTAATNSSAKT